MRLGVEPPFSNSSGLANVNGASDFRPSQIPILLDLNCIYIIIIVMASMDVRQFLRAIIYYQKTIDSQKHINIYYPYNFLFSRF